MRGHGKGDFKAKCDGGNAVGFIRVNTSEIMYAMRWKTCKKKKKMYVQSTTHLRPQPNSPYLFVLSDPLAGYEEEQNHTITHTSAVFKGQRHLSG